MPLPKGAQYPIYPQPIPERGQNDNRVATMRGLTLLDHFAILALPVAEAQLSSVETSSNHPPHTYHGTPAEVAALAYDLAEALLTERAKRLNQTDNTPAA